MAALSPRNRLALDFVLHCRSAHRSHLPGAVGCPLCQAARRLLAGEALSPQALIGSLEASIPRGVCTAPLARHLEEQVLQRTTAEGNWK
jgi:hypothetical protein